MPGVQNPHLGRVNVLVGQPPRKPELKQVLHENKVPNVKTSQRRPKKAPDLVTRDTHLQDVAGTAQNSLNRCLLPFHVPPLVLNFAVLMKLTVQLES